ncbi:phage portal protein [Desulfovibrio cuneatus]|uniref:phage portal protein n=1 Tax=Desulfovibrio cuneatus TaxID=159728 RepID=UPI0004224743|nr:phage portal protein [Desulfovibrio cuneatus]
MIFSQGAALTQEALRRAMLHGSHQRKAETAKALDFYHNQQEPHILEQLQRYYKHRAKSIDPVSVNIVKKIINLKSTVYLEDATRTVSGTPQDAEIFKQLQQQAQLGVVMKTANRYSTLLGTLLLRPVWRKGRMMVDVITGNFCDVVTGDTPHDLQAVVIEHFSQNGRPDEVTFTRWTAESVAVLDYASNVISEEPNPYKCLPFVSLFDSQPQGEFWQPGAADLILTQEAINKRLSDLWRVLDFQGFSVGLFRGVPKGHTQPEVDPGTIICLTDKDSNFEFRQPNAPVEETLEAVDRLIKWAAVTNGISATAVNTEIVEESGIAKVVGRSELVELRRDQIAAFGPVEQSLFELFRTIWNVHNPTRRMSEGATLSVDFYDPRPEASLSERVQELQALFQLGLASPVDYLQEMNPDLSREEAETKLRQIRADLANYQQEIFA